MLQIAHSCLLLAVALLWTSSGSLAAAQPAPAPAPPAAATLAAARGQALFEVENYDAASTEFTAAYRLLEGYPHRYRVLSNLALCHERRFHYDLAIELYERYLAEGGARVDDRAAVETSIARLAKLLATVAIDSNVPADVWLDDRKIGRAPGTVRVPPGRHLLELRAHLYESARRALDVEAGANLELRFELNRLSQFSGLAPAYFWTFTALGTATLAVGVAFGVSALDADSEARDRARTSPWFNRPEDERSIRRRAATADVMYASAAVLAASSVVLFFLTDWEAEPSERAAAPRLTPYAAPDAGGLRLRGAL